MKIIKIRFFSSIFSSKNQSGGPAKLKRVVNHEPPRAWRRFNCIQWIQSHPVYSRCEFDHFCAPVLLILLFNNISIEQSNRHRVRVIGLRALSEMADDHGFDDDGIDSELDSADGSVASSAASFDLDRFFGHAIVPLLKFFKTFLEPLGHTKVYIASSLSGNNEFTHHMSTEADKLRLESRLRAFGGIL